MEEVGGLETGIRIEGKGVDGQQEFEVVRSLGGSSKESYVKD